MRYSTTAFSEEASKNYPKSTIFAKDKDVYEGRRNNCRRALQETFR